MQMDELIRCRVIPTCIYIYIYKPMIDTNEKITCCADFREDSKMMSWEGSFFAHLDCKTISVYYFTVSDTVKYSFVSYL